MADPRVVDWYDKKTDFLLEKYRVGHRIHYHTGLVEPDLVPAANLDELRHQIWKSQEDMLDRAAVTWNADRWLRGDVIDIGCGLGGGPLYWAEKYGARVTGLTPIPAHVPIIERSAERAGVSGLVRAVVGDAHSFPGESLFDAAVATGASNYFDRGRWFTRLGGLLRRDGRVFIEDTFAGRPDMVAPFNDYWISNIGTFDSYRAAASAAGFELVRCEDVTRSAAGFWRLSVAYSQRLLDAGGLGAAAVEERRRSILWQTQVFEAYLDGGFQNLLVCFARTSP